MSRGGFRVRQRLRVNSLEAAICNVALFKSMKEKDFKDKIYISYQRGGTMLEALTEDIWSEASDHVRRFLSSKAISLFIEGHPKDVYECVIDTDLKQMHRRFKAEGGQVPYINIIHFQRLRKSCEYMYKEGYQEPLQEWQSTFRKHPNFAFLLVEPISRQAELKRQIIGYIQKRHKVPLAEGPKARSQSVQLKFKYFFYLKFQSCYQALFTTPSVSVEVLARTVRVTRSQANEENKRLWERLQTLKSSSITCKVVCSSQSKSKLLNILQNIPAVRQSCQARIISNFDVRAIVANEHLVLRDCYQYLEGKFQQKYGGFYLLAICNKQSLPKVRRAVEEAIVQSKKLELPYFHLQEFQPQVQYDPDSNSQLIDFRGQRCLLKLYQITEQNKLSFMEYFAFLRKINCPNVPKLYAAGLMPGSQSPCFGMVYQFVRGVSIRSTIVDYLQAVKLGIKVLEIISYIQKRVANYMPRLPPISFRNDSTLVTHSGVFVFPEWRPDLLHPTELVVLAGRSLYHIFEGNDSQAQHETSPLLFVQLSEKDDKQAKIIRAISRMLLRKYFKVETGITEFEQIL